jgi:SAM-dependent methyltransferase
LDELDTYDAAIQVYGELNTFSDEARDKLLSVVRRSLRPGGRFLFDLSTRVHRGRVGNQNRWWTGESSFWSPTAHIVLEQGFDDPERSLWVDQTVVLDASGIRVFRNWFHDYDPEAARAFLASAGMRIEYLWNDLAGTPYQESGEWFALCAEVDK